MSAIEQPLDESRRFLGALGVVTANGDGGHYPEYDRRGFGDVGARVECSFGYRTDPTDDNEESTQGEKESRIATAGGSRHRQGQHLTSPRDGGSNEAPHLDGIGSGDSRNGRNGGASAL